MIMNAIGMSLAIVLVSAFSVTVQGETSPCENKIIHLIDNNLSHCFVEQMGS